MDIKIKDRDKDIDYVRMAVNMVGVGMDYKTTKLMMMALKKVDKLGDKFTLKDAAKIESDWSDEMNEYYENEIDKK